MRRSHRLWLAGTLLALALAFVVPVASCPACSGTGHATVMGSHPEAMGSESAPTGVLLSIPCPSCDGSSRVPLYRKLM